MIPRALRSPQGATAATPLGTNELKIGANIYAPSNSYHFGKQSDRNYPLDPEDLEVVRFHHAKATMAPVA